MRRAILALGLVALPLLLVPPAWAGWEIQFRDGRGRQGRLWLDARYGMRLEGKAGRRTIIMRTDRELTYIVQHRRATYQEMNWADVRKARELAAEMPKRGELLERMEGALKEAAPPEKRGLVERGLKGLRRFLGPAQEQGTKAKAKPRVRPTGRKKTLHGFATEEVVVEEGGRTHTFWVSREPRLAPLAETFAQIAEKMAKGVRGPGGVGALFGAQRALFREFKGVPIRSEVQIPGKKRRQVTEFTSVSEQAFSSFDFKPPAGYEKSPLGPR